MVSLSATMRRAIGWLGLAPRRRLNHTRSLLHPDRTVVRGITRQLAAQPSDAANLLALGSNGLLTLDVSTEAEAHGRKHLFAEGMLLPRAETGVERRGDHIRGDRFRQPERVWISACSRLSHPAGLSEIESGLF